MDDDFDKEYESFFGTPDKKSKPVTAKVVSKPTRDDTETESDEVKAGPKIPAKVQTQVQQTRNQTVRTSSNAQAPTVAKSQSVPVKKEATAATTTVPTAPRRSERN